MHQSVNERVVGGPSEALVALNTVYLNSHNLQIQSVSSLKTKTPRKMKDLRTAAREFSRSLCICSIAPQASPGGPSILRLPRDMYCCYNTFSISGLGVHSWNESQEVLFPLWCNGSLWDCPSTITSTQGTRSTLHIAHHTKVDSVSFLEFLYKKVVMTIGPKGLCVYTSTP